MNQRPKRPPRLKEIFAKYRFPLYFVTITTYDRKKCLANSSVHEAFIRFGEAQQKRGTTIGGYVIMEDHIHLFIRLNPTDELGRTIGFMKRSLSKTLNQCDIQPPHWQPGFFDHLVRSAKSYSEKWDYVYKNPERAGLIESAKAWPYTGEIQTLSF